MRRAGGPPAVALDEPLGGVQELVERAPLGYLGPVAAWIGTRASVVERQLPYAVLMALAFAGLLLPGLKITSGAGVAVAGIVTAVLLLLAAVLPWARLSRLAPEVLTVLQFVAIAALRQGTGGMASPFSGMVLLPALTLAARAGRTGVLVGPVLAALTVVVGLLFSSDEDVVQPVVVRALVVAMIALITGAVVHETTSRLRQRNAALRRMQERQAELLRRAQDAAVDLARVAAVRREAHDQLVSVIDSVTEQAIIATDADGLIEVFNAGAERLLGFAQGDVVGSRHLTDLHLTSELLERCADRGAPALAGPQDARTLLTALLDVRVGAQDWTYVRSDGSHVVVRPAVTRRTEADGAVAGYVVVASDVTAEREAQRLKEQFVGLVSHELRTPLTAVLGYVELLLDGTEPLSDDQREFLGIIDRNARRQLRLVGDLLLTAQVEAGTFQVTPQEVDLADVARVTIASARPAARAAGVALEGDVRATPVQADPVRVGQALDNLVANALKFTERGGTVRVEVGPVPDGGARVVVRDTGVGIAPAELAHLTERFYRASSATSRAVPGVGLGLSITRAVVEAHGGTVEIESVLGEGTAFTVTLPARPSV